MIYSKIKYLLFISLALLISGCGSSYDYSIHKPKVRYKPSLKSLDRLNKINMGKRYVWAEEGPYCFDCSGFTYFTYGSMGIELPRVAKEQFKKGTPISKSELQKGDLVFFGNKRTGVATHVGIYIGNGKFEHASTAKKRVVVSSLNKPYYKKHYLGARRYHNFTTQYNSYSQYKPVQSAPTFKPTYTPKPKVREDKKKKSIEMIKNIVVEEDVTQTPESPSVEVESSSESMF